MVDWRERISVDNSSSCDKRTDTFDTIRVCSANGQTGKGTFNIFFGDVCLTVVPEQVFASSPLRYGALKNRKTKSSEMTGE